MKLITTYILICFLFFSCVNRKDNQSVVEVGTSNEVKTTLTNDIKIEFLNEVLNDKNNKYIYAYDYQNPYIRFESYDFNRNTVDVSLRDSLGRITTFVGFLSSWLKEKDTTFLNSQIESNKHFSLNPLRSYGYNILDWKSIHNDTIINNDGYLISKDSLETLSNDRFKKGEFEISDLFFNRNLDLAYFHIYYFMSHGRGLLYQKTNGKWEIKGEIQNFVH